MPPLMPLIPLMPLLILLMPPIDEDMEPLMLPILLMDEDIALSGEMVRSISFSRVSLLPSAASTIISMLAPSSVTSATVVVSCSAAATCI